MQTAQLFDNGKSQVVRLPKEFRLEGDEIVIKRLGGALLLFPRRYNARELKALLDELDVDFKIVRDQTRCRRLTYNRRLTVESLHHST